MVEVAAERGLEETSAARLCETHPPSEERDLFRLACNACWEILECVEWGTVVLLQFLSGSAEQMEPNMSAEPGPAAFHVQIKAGEYGLMRRWHLALIKGHRAGAFAIKTGSFSCVFFRARVKKKRHSL